MGAGDLPAYPPASPSSGSQALLGCPQQSWKPGADSLPPMPSMDSPRPKHGSSVLPPILLTSHIPMEEARRMFSDSRPHICPGFCSCLEKSYVPSIPRVTFSESCPSCIPQEARIIHSFNHSISSLIIHSFTHSTSSQGHLFIQQTVRVIHPLICKQSGYGSSPGYLLLCLRITF